MKRLLVVALGVAVSACVSSSKYDGVVKNLKDCQGQVGACATDRDGARARVTELEKQNADLTSTLDKVQAGAGATATELAALRKHHADAERRLASFKALTARFQKMIDSGKLKIGFRNGLMIVKLPAGILFASGKADLSEEGEVTVTEVGAVLKDVTDRRFLITGHTDNVPLKRGKFKDNWELSTARALVVSRWLVEQGMNPKAIAAAGYSEFDPVADTATEAGRQENRRIEIVLMPNIEELPAMPTN